MEKQKFKAIKRDFSADMLVNAPVEEVFPLFCPTRENYWLPNWEEMCTLLWSESGFAELGAIFQTRYNNLLETWVISRYDHLQKVEFVRHNPNLITRMSIEVESRGEKTAAKWSQSKVALTEEGKSLLDKESPESYSTLINKLEILLNHYTSTGRMMSEESLRSRGE